MSRIATRTPVHAAVTRLTEAGTPPLLARLYAARGVESADELNYELKALLPPAAMKGLAEAAKLLADAIAAQEPMLIVADYDCDGATACAVGLRGLRAMGGKVDYLVPPTHRRRLRPDCVHRRAGRSAPPQAADHRRQRHRQRRRRRRGAPPGHQDPGHRSPPARRHAPRGRCDRQPRIRPAAHSRASTSPVSA